MSNLPGAKHDHGRIISQLKTLRFQVFSPSTARITRKGLDDVIRDFVQTIAEEARLKPWLIIFVWFATHGIQNGNDNFPHILATDSRDVAAQCLGIRSQLIRPLNKIVAVQPGRLRVICVFDCCRENVEDNCYSRGPNYRNLLSRFRNDFYFLFACDPGSKAFEEEQGGELAAQLLPLLSYEAPISQIFLEASRRVRCQRPWVEARAGDREPVLGDHPCEFPVLLGHTNGPTVSPKSVPQVVGLPDGSLSPVSFASSPSPSHFAGSMSDFDILRLYWAPALALFMLFVHAVLLLSWLCDVVEKCYATRLAMMLVLSFFGSAQVLEGNDEDELPTRCGLMSRLHGLRQIWHLVDKYSCSGWGAGALFLLGFGEITKERDFIAAAISFILAIVAICANSSKCKTFASLRARSTDTSRRRCACLWLCVCLLSVYFVGMGRHALLSSPDVAEEEIEANFHMFLLVFVVAEYMSFVHDSDPALSGCSSSANCVVSTYMLVPLLAIGIPLLQSVNKSASFGSSSLNRQIWLLVEYSGMFFFLAACYKFRQAHAEDKLVADQACSRRMTNAEV
eukprot:Skav232387  [mRNA]  locus=scaffold1077:376074:377771:- [translate_table: standard]